MLNALRGATGNWFAKIFLVLVAASFSVWGIADIFGDYGNRSVAQIGQAEVSSEAFDAAYQRELSSFAQRLGRRLTPDEARALGIDRRVLNQLLTSAALSNEAYALNLSVSDEYLAEQVANDPSFRDAFGRFNPTRFQNILANAGYTESQYLAERARTETRTQITSTVTGDLAAPSVLIDAFRNYQGARRITEYFILPVLDPGSLTIPSEDDLRAYYTDNEARFTAPEFRRLRVLAVEPVDLTATIDIDESEIEAEYNSRRAEFETRERREIDQLLFADESKAREAHDILAGGGDFAAVASEYGFSTSDTDLGLVTQSEIVDPTIAEAAFSLENGAISEPVAGALGTAILRVRSVEPASVKPLEEVSGLIRTEIALEQATDEVIDLHDAVEDERAGGTSFAEIGDKLGLKYQEIDAVDRQGNAPDHVPTPDLPGGPDVLRVAFDSDIGLENDPVETRTGGFVWIEVVDITDPQLKAFESIRSDIETAWRTDEVQIRQRARARELADRGTNGETLEALASSLSTNVLFAEPITRRSPDAPFSAGLVSAAFAAPVGSFLPGETRDGAHIVARITEARAPEQLEEADARRLSDQVAAALGTDIFEQYVSGLQARDGVTINAEAINYVLGDGPRQ